jgi:hypothetical protein
MLCAAAADPCNIKIEICDHNNQPQPLTESDCAEGAGYTQLCRKIDGKNVPGRFTTP